MAFKRTIVSDTSPLRYLAAIIRADLLGVIFEKVLISRGVEQELMNPSAPDPVKKWMAQRPAWLEVRELLAPLKPDLSRHLHLGEAETIQLAMELKLQLLLMDERRGRQKAANNGLSVVGTLGILLQAYRQRLIDNPLEMLKQLRAARFRLSPRVAHDFEEEVRLIKASRV